MITPAAHEVPSAFPVTFERGAEAIGQAVLASLPLSYFHALNDPDQQLADQRSRGTEGAGVVHIIDGAAQGWVENALAACQTSAGIIVVEPGPADTRELIRAASASGTAVVLDSTWASNSAVEAAAPEFQAALTAGIRVESRVILPCGGDLPAALLHHLLLTQSLVGAADRLEIEHWSPNGYHAEARAGSTIITLSGVCTSAVPASMNVRMLTGAGSIELSIPSPETARPAIFTTVGPTGALQAPTLWESGHRASWRQLLTVLRRTEPSESPGGPRAGSLHAFQSASDLVTEALREARSFTA